ncbi:10890_t:CDS:2, partial [Gigaspora margarita]
SEETSQAENSPGVDERLVGNTQFEGSQTNPRNTQKHKRHNEVCDNTINEYRHHLHNLMNIQQPTSDESATSASSTNLLPNNMFKDLIF